MKGKDNLSDGEKTGTGRKAVERQTELGMIKVDMEYPYPCVPPPEIREEKDGKLLIITASHTFRIRNGKMEISPVLYQSCMHPEKSILIRYRSELTERKSVFRCEISSGQSIDQKRLWWKSCPGKRKSKRKAVSHVRTAEDAAGKGGKLLDKWELQLTRCGKTGQAINQTYLRNK